MAKSHPNPRLEAKFSRWSYLDSFVVWVVGGFGVFATLSLLLVPKFFLPAEDAVILFQYSRNLANSGAITFIPNGVRAEGATDFAWMVLLSVGMRLGLNAFWLIAFLNVAAILFLSFLLIRIAGSRVRPLSLFFVVGSFALMPQIFAAASGFSTLPYAFLLVFLASRFLCRDDIGTPLLGLTLCLFRPDGVVIAVPLLLSALVIYPQRFRRVALDTVLYIIPGIIYFIWRWRYFGQFLPLPFLVKSDTPRYAHLLVLGSVKDGRFFLLFALILLGFVLQQRLGDSRNRAVLLSLVLLPNLFYFSMRLDQDVGHRFFIYLPVGTAVLLAMNWQAIRPRSFYLLRVGVIAAFLCLSRAWFFDFNAFRFYQFDNRKAISEELARLHGGTMIVTEAGFLPFYSQWPTYDAWGLNTAAFSKRLIQPADVSGLHPDLVFLHTDGDRCTPQLEWQTPYAVRTWEHLSRNLVAGVPSSQFDLWYLPFGNAHNRTQRKLQPWQSEQECWFVRRDSPLRFQIETILMGHGALTAEQHHALADPAQHR
jgi:hypothetical protein